MQRYFNTEGQCEPNKHYMVRLDDRLEKIKRLFVDRGKYFIINRGRQYGKTTTLRLLAEFLKDDYVILSMDFQMMSSANFADEQTFVISFMAYVKRVLSAKKDTIENLDTEAFQNLLSLKKEERISMDKMFCALSGICQIAKKPVVLMIDEVDSASNYRVFLDFLAMLRGYYLDRENSPIFHSVILAGVYDIKNLKLKIRPEEEHQYNSPWNIAARFHIDMSFTAVQIASMLEEYEQDNHTGMNVEEMARCIYDYTSGYPYLVSAICKFLDEEIPELAGFEDMGTVWTKEGIREAVKILLNENTPLFDSMVKQLDTFKDLKELIEQLLYRGRRILFSPAEKSLNLGLMFGYFKDDNGRITIANRIFEMYLLNLFIAEDSIKSEIYLSGQDDKNQFIRQGRLDMDLVLEKFVVHFTDIYGDNDEKFLEKYGRKFFLLYLKPIINGIGNYYLEAETRDARRTDVVVDYRGEQFVIELKIWRGNEYNERGEEQLAEYLDYYRLEKGYLVSFNFNRKKEVGVKTIRMGGKMIVEAVV